MQAAEAEAELSRIQRALLVITQTRRDVSSGGGRGRVKLGLVTKADE